MNRLKNQPEMNKSSENKKEEVMQEQVVQEPQQDKKFPTEIVDLPSKGLLYSEDNPLSKGQIEIKYMTAKEEDILTTESYIKNNVAIDKLLRNLIVTPGIRYNTMLTGDKNALMIAARKYGYGPKYVSEIRTPSNNTIELEIDLNEIKFKDFNEDQIEPGKNEFTYETEIGGDTIKFRMLTVGDFKKLSGTNKKTSKQVRKLAGDNNITGQMIHSIIEVNGERDRTKITEYVYNMLARDARAFRQYYKEIEPNLDLSIELEDEETGEFFRTKIDIGYDFFYPDLEQ